jgi:hypothetical protein
MAEHSEAHERIGALSWALPCAGLAILVSVGLVSCEPDTTQHRIGALVLAVTSALGIGALVGFLFGIPRALATEQPEGRLGFEQNTNLEQVSDWLTKIIVGVGLVEAKGLSGHLSVLSIAAAKAWGWDGNVQAVVAGCLLVASALLGFMGTYIWTRTDFLLDLAINKEELKKLIALAEEAKRERERAERERDKALVSFNYVQGTTSRRDASGSQEITWGQLYDSDPNKAAFGGSASRDGLTLDAEIQPLTSDGSLFGLRLVVAGTPENPLRDVVRFYLHPTFDPDVVEVAPVDGKAELKTVAEEAFTVGAEVRNGPRLELDLNKVPSAPDGFRWDSSKRREARERRSTTPGRTPP